VLYEESAKVPWLMRIPQFQRQQISVDNAVSHIDLVPTLLDIMKSPQKPELPGKSLVPQIHGENNQNSNVFIQWNPGSGFTVPAELQEKYGKEKMTKIANASMRTIVSPEGWKLSLCNGDKSQLFNLEKDPFEKKNLFYIREYQPVISELTAKIHAWQKSVGDEVVI